jgi:hypothetical protein
MGSHHQPLPVLPAHTPTCAPSVLTGAQPAALSPHIQRSMSLPRRATDGATGRCTCKEGDAERDIAGRQEHLHHARAPRHPAAGQTTSEQSTTLSPSSRHQQHGHRMEYTAPRHARVQGSSVHMIHQAGHCRAPTEPPHHHSMPCHYYWYTQARRQLACRASEQKPGVPPPLGRELRHSLLRSHLARLLRSHFTRLLCSYLTRLLCSHLTRLLPCLQGRPTHKALHGTQHREQSDLAAAVA